MQHLTTTVGQFAAEEAQGIAALGIDITAILLQACTFLILFILIKKYAFEKIVNNMESRRKTIEEGLVNAHKAEVRLQNTKVETEQILRDARSEAENVITNGQKEATEIVKKAADDATVKAEGIIKDASAKLERDANKVKNEIKTEMLSLVAEATEAVINQKLDSKADSELIAKAIKEN